MSERTRTASFSNHAAVRVRLSDRERIRKFYGDVLGCKLVREFEDKDDFRMGDDFYIAFLYASGRGVEADQGIPYAADEALRDDDFSKAMFLELKTDDVEALKRRIIAFGVKLLEVPDVHLYFQAPGGQVWRLVGSNEDLSRYEGDTRDTSRDTPPREAAVKRPVTAQLRPAPVARAVTDGELVLATIDVRVPPERAFQALMSAECERWWGAAGVYTTESWHADVRTGGSWSLVTRLPDGTALPASGEFLEVALPSKVVQTRRYDWAHPTLARTVTRVTTQFAPLDGGAGTRVTVRHEGFGSSEPAYEHAGGWERLLDWLGAHLAAEAGAVK